MLAVQARLLLKSSASGGGHVAVARAAEVLDTLDEVVVDVTEAGIVDEVAVVLVDTVVAVVEALVGTAGVAAVAGIVAEAVAV